MSLTGSTFLSHRRGIFPFFVKISPCTRNIKVDPIKMMMDLSVAFATDHELNEDIISFAILNSK